MRGSSPRMTVSTRLAVLTFRRARPRPLRTAQALESLCHAQHADGPEAAARDMHADPKSAPAKAARDRGGGDFRHRPRHSVAARHAPLSGVLEPGGEFACA